MSEINKNLMKQLNVEQIMNSSAESDKKVDNNDIHSGEKCEVTVKSEESDDKAASHRENRLTSIIEQLKCQSKLKGNGGLQRDPFDYITNNGVAGESRGARRCVRDAAAASPAHAPATAAVTAVSTAAAAAPAPTVKSERLSPHDSTASRSRSVTPSTSSYPGTPPERGSPHAPAPQPPRNYSDIMRSLAARYNAHPHNDYFHRMNGFGTESARSATPAQVSVDISDAPVGGLFTKLAKQQGGPPRLPAFPVMLDMSSTKTLLAISRVGRGGRSRRKRTGAGAASDHCPLDLSAAGAGESAAKRARLSASPSTRSDSDDNRANSDDRSSECLCSEARSRLSAWSVDDVCDFVTSIDICAEYATNFREQRIDGAGLPLLTEDHLTGMLQMKLGPALKLKAVLGRRLEPCSSCQALSGACPSPTRAQNNNNIPPMNNNVTPRLNGNALKSEPRSNPTSPS